MQEAPVPGAFFLRETPGWSRVGPEMSPVLAKIVLVGIPFVLSVGWFVFWVVKLTREARKRRNQPRAPGPGGEQSLHPPG